ncbi:MAG TPA: tetratricopeptide repeat protein, partial [Syntrophorhabdaceae bacterium]
MLYQLPPVQDENIFEKLVRDVLRREYDDPGIECFGRKGQSQYGIDGYSPAKSGVTFQCKLKDTRYKPDADLCGTLSSEMEIELEKTRELRISRFIFASTFKNDAHLQQKAQNLSSHTLIVEYWGWDTITEKIWKYAEELVPSYYPHIPIRKVPGLREIIPDAIRNTLIQDSEERKQLALDYYRINDRDDVVFKVVCNDLDVRNDAVMQDAFTKLESLPSCSTLWVVGTGGSGKTTILYRLAIELAQKNHHVFVLNLEAQLGRDGVELVLNTIRYKSPSDKCILCIDNPAADEETLSSILRRIPELNRRIHVLLSERGHRFQAMKKSGTVTFIHGEEESALVVVKNPHSQRQLVYNRLFDLLGIEANTARDLSQIILNERIVYVNATYTVLLELKKKRKIDFAFDWDDFQKLTDDLPSFRDSYKYIALFYLMGVRAHFDVLARVCGADEAQKGMFLSRFRGLQHEPIVLTEWRDELYQKQVLLRTKHEIISEIYFREHPEIDKNELMMEWCEKTYFNNIFESQTLVNIFGAKKNYFADQPFIDYELLINFMLREGFAEKVQQSRKLYETLHLARFWILLSQGRETKAIEALNSALVLIPYNLHFRTELAKIYQHQGKYDEAEKILMESLVIDEKQLHPRTELAKIYQHQGKYDEAEKILMES